MVVQTVRKILKDIPRNRWKREKMTRDLKGMVGHPIDREYKDMVSRKMPPNFPITKHDTTNGNFMVGPDLAGVIRNTLIKKPRKGDMVKYVNIPEDFYKIHKFVTLTDEVIFSIEICL